MNRIQIVTGNRRGSTTSGTESERAPGDLTRFARQHCGQRDADYHAHPFAHHGSTMIRIREISDPELKQRIIAKLAERRGLLAGAVPEWFELDDADFVDLLNDLRDDAAGDESLEPPHEPRG
jgi:hypothetical protein